MNACFLCSSLGSRDIAETWNQPLLESQNFVVIPSLGALVEGWLLLVPKDHYLCLGALPNELIPEFQMMKHNVSELLHQKYGSVVIFEHGPARPSAGVGCSVDHAHLHLVPLEFDLARASIGFLPQCATWNSATFLECQQAFEQGQDYLYLEQTWGSGLIATHEHFGSQLFRRAIAAHIGYPDQFAWRENPQFPIVEQTIKAIQAFRGSVQSSTGVVSGP